MESNSRMVRWVLSALSAVVLTILTILPIVKSIRREPPEEIPVLLVDFLELPPERKKEVPKITRRKAPPKEKSPRERITPTPAPTITKQEAAEPAEQTLTTPHKTDTVEQPAPAPGTAGIVSVSSDAQLDNVSYEPMGHCLRPAYPSIAQRAGITGYVDVDLLIDENGRVKEFSFGRVTGHPAFRLETAKVLPKWRFPPPRIGGRKVQIRYTYRVNFKLD
jgi:protein TonB